MAGARYYQSAMTEKRVQQQRLESVTRQLSQLQQHKVNLELENKINQESLEKLREQIVFLQDHMAQQGEELGLYRTLIADQTGHNEITVESLTLSKSEEA